MTYSKEYKGLYKQALLEGIARKAGSLVGKTKSRFGYVADAVKKARPQYSADVTDTGYSMHGSVLKALEENGAFGASAIRKGFDKARMIAEDVDTGLGAMAIGKKGLESGKGIRHDLFTMKARNWIQGKPSDSNPYGKDLGVQYQASRPSITAPLESVGAMVVPILALNKGYEILESQREKTRATNAQQYNEVQSQSLGG